VNRARQRFTIAAAAGALALGAVGAGVLQASSASATPSPATTSGGSTPKGNAGTIKINGVELADTPRNVPHVTCDFTVAFYGYAAGSHTAHLTFEGQAPTRATSGSDVVLDDTLTFSGGKGGSTLDASKAYRLDLSRFPVHPKQGVHVKLTVHVPGSKGADVKHKVFWVEPCTTSPGPSPSPTPTTPGPTPTPTPTETTPVPTPSTTTPAPTPSSSGPSVGNPQPSPSSTSSSGNGTCTGDEASSPDCTTVSTAPHFTG
jgi:hypothetical protein